MKKHCFMLAAALSFSMVLCACGTSNGKASQGSDAGTEEKSAETGESTWEPKGEVSFIVCSSAGGGSDIYTRKMIEIMNGEGISNANFIVKYMTDGGGETGRQYVADARKGDEVLVAMEYGGFANMLLNTGYRIENFRPIAVVAEECQILLAKPDGKYASVDAAIEAAKGGTTVSVAGSGQADDQMYQLMKDAFGLDETNFTYIRCSSTSDAITSTLGGHSDFVLARASACISYVESNDLKPIVALQEERFEGVLDCPTIGELGYGDIKVPLWRGVCGPKSMSDEAYAYYCDIFKKMAESSRWQTEYCDQYQAIKIEDIGEDAVTYMTDAQTTYLETHTEQ